MVLKLCVYVHAGMHVRTLQGQTVPPGDASPSSLLSRFFLFFFNHCLPPPSSIPSPLSSPPSFRHSFVFTRFSLCPTTDSHHYVVNLPGWDRPREEADILRLSKESVWVGVWGEAEGKRVIWLKKTHLQSQQNENTVSLILHNHPLPPSQISTSLFLPLPLFLPSPHAWGACVHACRVQVWVSSKQIEGKAKRITLKLPFVEIYYISGVHNCTPAWACRHAHAHTFARRRRWNKK